MTNSKLRDVKYMTAPCTWYGKDFYHMTYQNSPLLIDPVQHKRQLSTGSILYYYHLQRQIQWNREGATQLKYFVA